MTTVAANANTGFRSLDSFNIAALALGSAQKFGRAAQDVAGGANPLQALVNQFQNTSNPLEQGALLRSLDTASGGRSNTDALLRDGGAPAAAPSTTGTATPVAPTYDAASLFGPHGPRLSDIQQGQMNDCALLGTLGALANERPSAIRDAITYDAATQNFTVRLYDSSGAEQLHTVTQADITANIARGGGSRRDDGITNAPIWPDVMEVARAKQTDTNHADGLDQGYNDIAAFPDEAMRAITGTGGTTVAFNQNAGETRADALARMGTELHTAIRSDKPVTAWIRPEGSTNGYSGTKEDGLLDDHVYTMARAFQGKDGNWYVTLRNPWGTNSGIEGSTRESAFITMSLDKLERLGGLQSFQIGD